MINAPVLHVNGDYPEGRVSLVGPFSGSPHSIDVERAVDVAFKYRNHFRKDVIIDLLVYRRWQVLLCNPVRNPEIKVFSIGATTNSTSPHSHNL